MKKRIALVTGGMGGIGSAICRALHDRGMRVIAGYNRAPDAAERWLDEQQRDGYRFDCKALNVTDFSTCEQAIHELESDIGPIDILINNAGITRDCSCRKMDKATWDEVINTDLNGVFYVTRALIHFMIERQYGRIINVSSVNAQKGQFGQANYAAAKAGLHGFTKALALELAKKGITVNTVSPGYVETDMVKTLDEKMREKIIEEIPMKRFASPEEVAHVITFLTDEKSGYITGANIPVNGGHYFS